MRYARDDPGHTRLATLDIETTSTDPDTGELVAIGVGVHDRSTPLSAATYRTIHRQGDDEVDLIRDVFAWLGDAGADALVTYNGAEFDLGFLEGRLERHGAAVDRPALAAPDTHVDLFLDRQRAAEQAGEPWPSLEECLDSYGFAPATTRWNGEPIDNTRFGDELGPAYLRTLGTATGHRLRDALGDAIDHYLTTDLEATLALFYADIGEGCEPRHLGTAEGFEV